MADLRQFEYPYRGYDPCGPRTAPRPGLSAPGIFAAVGAGRAELVRLHRARQINDETLHDLEHDLALEELSATTAKG